MHRFILVLLSLFTLAVANVEAAAQDKYPSRPVKILVPFGAGSATDIVIRIIGEQMRQNLGHPIIVDNKPGAFGIVAIEEMARSKPDGYTLQVGNVGTNAVTPVLYRKKLSIDYERDVVPVARLTDVPLFFVATTKSFPPTSLAELVEYARQHPGKVRYASVGVGSNNHFDMEIFAKRAGLEMIHIPIKAGGAGMTNDLVTGDSQIGLVNIASAGSMIKAGQLRALAVVSDQRLTEYPDVATMAELGYPGVGTPLWSGLFAPAGTPKDVLEMLHKSVIQALNSAPVQDAFKKQVIRAVPTASLDEARTWLKDEMAAWSRIVSEVKVELTD
jgi:tripartite-type tricarboxylate transporter receptor subunit TctC